MHYKIAFLSKYPPLEGGIAAKTYWLATGLAERGHEIHVITHGAHMAHEYQIENSESPRDKLRTLKLHRITENIPWHIPEDDEVALSLLNLSVDVIQKHGIQILDTGYLVPYGILGHLAKKLSGVCHIVRHGGSDLEKFLKPGIFSPLLMNTIAGADMIITDKVNEGIFMPITSHLICQPAYVPNEMEFMATKNSKQRKHLAFIGKINFHWQYKALPNIAEIMGQLMPEYECWIVGQGKGLNDFKQSLTNELFSAIHWKQFVPPWEMPAVINQLDAVFIFESMLPHPVISNLALEAVSAGVGIITDRSDFADTYKDIVTLNEGQVLLVSPTEPTLAAEKVRDWIDQKNHGNRDLNRRIGFDDYLSANELVYSTVLGAASGK